MHVGDDDDTLILAFHLQERLGDQTFQHALVLLVAGIEGLVAEQQDAIAQMFIEATDQLKICMPWWPKALGPNDRRCPSRSLFTAQNEGDFAGLARLLVQPGEPVRDIICMVGDIAADHLLDVIPEQAPISGFWFDGEATPQVHVS